MSVGENLRPLMSDELEEAIQILYHEWRDAIGDSKMDSRPFYWRPQDMAGFAAWVQVRIEGIANEICGLEVGL